MRYTCNVRIRRITDPRIMMCKEQKEESLGQVKIVESISFTSIEFEVLVINSQGIANAVFKGPLRHAKVICMAFMSIGYEGNSEAIY